MKHRLFDHLTRFYEDSPVGSFRPLVELHSRWREHYGPEHDFRFWTVLHTDAEITDEGDVKFDDDTLRIYYNKSTRTGIKNKFRETFSTLGSVEDFLAVIIQDLRPIVYCVPSANPTSHSMELWACLEAMLCRSFEGLEGSAILYERLLCDNLCCLIASFESYSLLKYLNKHPTTFTEYKKASIRAKYEMTRKYMKTYLEADLLSSQDVADRLAPIIVELAEVQISVNEDGTLPSAAKRFNWSKIANESLEFDPVFKEHTSMRFLELVERRNDVAHTRWSCLSAFARVDSNRVDNSWALPPKGGMTPFVLIILLEFFSALRILRPDVPDHMQSYFYFLWRYYDRLAHEEVTT